ncbi:MAG: hypothetical protein IKP67_01155, partial [Spirochaetales bacterium]|nr:hypothetical protein [Spirochaetales bacterium]
MCYLKQLRISNRATSSLIILAVMAMVITSCRSDINEALSGGKYTDPELSQIDSSEPVIANPEDNDLLSDRMPISKVRENYSSDQDILRQKSYTNIRFDNCS